MAFPHSIPHTLKLLTFKVSRNRPDKTPLFVSMISLKEEVPKQLQTADGKPYLKVVEKNLFLLQMSLEKT